MVTNPRITEWSKPEAVTSKAFSICSQTLENPKVISSKFTLDKSHYITEVLFSGYFVLYNKTDCLSAASFCFIICQAQNIQRIRTSYTLESKHEFFLVCTIYRPPAKNHLSITKPTQSTSTWCRCHSSKSSLPKLTRKPLPNTVHNINRFVKGHYITNSAQSQLC